MRAGPNTRFSQVFNKIESNNQKFVVEVDKFAKSIGVTIKQAQEKVAYDLFSMIVKATPVGTGRAKGNWIPSSGTPVYDFDPERKDKDGSSTLAKMSSILESHKEGESIFITNSTPYILMLEYGWSKKAPNGMVRISVNSIKASMQNAISKK